VESRGYTLEEANINQLQPKVSTKDDVLRVLGTPSSKSYFGNDTWFYISSKAEKVAFMNAKTIEQHVIGIEFNEAGTITSLQQYSLSDARKVQFAKESTPTEGSDLTAVGQILGNVGRFNPSGGQLSPRTTPHGNIP
jgi:outer membrane protein assembly factor BamE (lipoprotein component of BamABCDE complex)